MSRGLDGWTLIASDGPLQVWRGPGEGPALVAAHGIEDSWKNWRELTSRIPGYTPYALQLPWHGGNTYEWPAGGGPADWLRRALALVPEPPKVLVGHSFGANAILEHLSTVDGDPGLDAVLLVAPFYRPADFSLSEQLRLRSLAAFRRVLSDGLRVSLGAGKISRMDPEVLSLMEHKLVERAVPAGFPVFYAAFEASGLHDLSRITVPTLVLVGRGDEGMTPMRAAALDRAMPAATLRIRPDYGHFCHLDQVEDMSAVTAAFLSDPRSAADSPEGGTPVTELLDGQPTSYVGSPRYEGANIRTWIGFKHFMYLVEEGVLQYFRDRGVGAREIYHRYGLGLEIVDSSVQLPVALEAEEQVYATVVSAKAKPGQGAPFTVTLTVERDGETVTTLKGKVRVALVTVKDGSGSEPIPSILEPYVVPDVSALTNSAKQTLTIADGQSVADVLAPEGSNAYLWDWRAPYYYCHFSDRLQHSAYIRTMEEVVDRFLADKNLAVGTLLDERGWIPVVSRARVQMVSDIYMEETVHTVFTVEDILKDTMYTARMDCFVRRGDTLELAATGTIMHGYAISRGEKAGTVAVLDEATQKTLLGGAA
ncbi:alpha/beta fold hydrolase [Streptomyces zagrosensis]|uniref:Pimeloyl-ACP methyl ester carboxylesterase/acyl-CoA thioesterase FadM n=1 Tax=Streptomyces zagrosensis TaxID=1042984 RepID=A0A7W9QH35_9ACTN|nr:alpha/beta fold hydrolase [Streptomyces zagrosensis]MBB5940165.1 pimeloyl-ACP methyl ester carboxylesterase/acyl-CoA thioesterase FadM [Streptomyces zagrosensis]